MSSQRLRTRKCAAKGEFACDAVDVSHRRLLGAISLRGSTQRPEGGEGAARSSVLTAEVAGFLRAVFLCEAMTSPRSPTLSRPLQPERRLSLPGRGSPLRVISGRMLSRFQCPVFEVEQASPSKSGHRFVEFLVLGVKQTKFAMRRTIAYSQRTKPLTR